MGTNKYESYERPVHKVAINSFFIGECEVTQELWEVVMGENPSMRRSHELPVEKVSWDDCQRIIAEDWYGSYSSEKQVNPIGPSDGLGRDIRGGSVNEDYSVCRITNRKYYDQNKLWAYIGLRLVMDVK